MPVFLTMDEYGYCLITGPSEQPTRIEIGKDTILESIDVDLRYR